MRLLLALPLLLGFAQDDAAIQDLIRRLDDGDPEIREKSQKDLIKAGSKALEPLRKALSSESAEVRVRAAQAIRAIENDLKSREAYPAYKPLSLKRSGTVGEFIEELAKQAGVKCDASPEQRGVKASVDASSLLQALDQICAGQDRLTFAVGDDGTIRFASERHPAFPASYFEAFKVYLTQTEVVRKSDYKETTVTGMISIHAAWEARLKPLKRVRYQSLKASDDGGRELEVVPVDPESMIGFGAGAGFVMAGFGDEADQNGPQPFTLKGLTSESKSVATLKGQAVVTFPLGRVDVAFEDPQKGASQTVGDMTIRLTLVSTKRNLINLTFAKSKGDMAGLKDEILGRLQADSVRAVDEEGKEHTGEIGPAPDDPGRFVIAGGPGGGETVRPIKFQATFSTLGNKEIKRFKFRFSDAVFELTVPFEIKDVKLP